MRAFIIAAALMALAPAVITAQTAGWPPHASGAWYEAGTPAYGMENGQGGVYAQLANGTKDPEAWLYVPVSYECIAETGDNAPDGQTEAKATFQLVIMSHTGEVSEGPTDKCETMQVGATTYKYADGEGDACPALTALTSTQTRVPSILPDLAGQPCPAEAGEAGKLGDASAAVDTSAFPKGAVASGPATGQGFQLEEAADGKPTTYGLQTPTGFVFAEAKSATEGLAAVLSDYISHTCTGDYSWTATAVWRTVYLNGTVEAEAACLAESYDPKTKVFLTALSTDPSKCPTTVTAATAAYTSKVTTEVAALGKADTKCGGAAPMPSPTPSPGPTPSPSPSPPSAAAAVAPAAAALAGLAALLL